MLRTTFLLEFVAVLTLLAVIKEGYCQMIVPKVQNLRCRGQICKERLVCTFDQLGVEPPEGYNLTLNNMETVRCQRADDKPNKKQCSFEGFKLKRFDNSLKLELSLVSNLKLKQNITPELEVIYTVPLVELPIDYLGCRYPQPPPVLKGFSHDPEKEELHIYWNVWAFANNDIETYTVNASSGQKASIVGRNFAIFRGWNPELPANVTLWIHNFQERMLSRTHLKVPILKNADQRQPQKVWYDDNTTSIYWDEPIEKDTLDGYTLYWCLKSSTGCDDWEDMYSYSVREYQNQFQFGSSMALYHIAVEANYRDGISGGMKWIVPPTKHEDFNIIGAITGSALVSIAILLVLGVIIFKKLRHNRGVSDIYSVPEGMVVDNFLYLTMKPIPRDSTSKEDGYVPHVPPRPPCSLSSTVDDEAGYTELLRMSPNDHEQHVEDN